MYENVDESMSLPLKNNKIYFQFTILDVQIKLSDTNNKRKESDINTVDLFMY